MPRGFLFFTYFLNFFLSGALLRLFPVEGLVVQAPVLRWRTAADDPEHAHESGQGVKAGHDGGLCHSDLGVS